MLRNDSWGGTIACLTCCALACASAVATSELQADQHFPYATTIGPESAYVRSGPGQRHYPTQVLRPGESLEVYRHDEGGWCAVRPPEGAFSWIASHDIQRQSEGYGVVAVERSTVRVGSEVSPARSAVQVLLYQGAPVQILPNEPHDDPRWLRISPPAGEFRWVALSDVSAHPDATANGVELTSAWTSQEEEETDHDREPTIIEVPHSPYDEHPFDPDEVQVVAGSPAERQLDTNRQATHPPGFAPPVPLSSVADSRPGDARIPASARGSFPPAPVNEVPVPTNEFPPLDEYAPSQSAAGARTTTNPGVEELALRLSQIVVRPKAEWDFVSLQREIQTRWEASDSVSERESLGDLLHRIASFQAVKNVDWDVVPTVGDDRHTPSHLHQSLSQERMGDTSRIRQLATDEPDIHDPFEHASVDNAALYDAVGKLKPVVSRKQEAPPYALINEHGEVVSFVTPSPDLNLQPYVGRRIGVHGSRGFLQEYRRAHVVAGKVTPIPTTARR